MKTGQSKKVKLIRLILVSIIILSIMIYKLFKGEPIYGIRAHMWLTLFFIVLFVDLKYNNFYKD